MTELQHIIETLEDTYKGVPWHGPNIQGTLSQIQESKKNEKVSNGHSIIQIVGHMISWRTFVCRRLNGDEAYDVTDEMNFPKSNNWLEVLEELTKSQQDLVDALSGFDPKKLDDSVPGRKYSFRKMIHGIIHHDLYHLGQIVMISKQF